MKMRTLTETVSYTDAVSNQHSLPSRYLVALLNKIHSELSC